MALVDVGCQIVRITAQTKRYAANLEHIVAGIRDRGPTCRWWRTFTSSRTPRWRR